MDAWMSPLGNENYNVSQPLLFVNTETFQWQKNMRQIKEFLNIETSGKRIKGTMTKFLVEKKQHLKNINIVNLIIQKRKNIFYK